MTSHLSSRRGRTLFFFYLRQVSAGLLIYQPIFIPFLLSRGLDLLDVAWLQTVYNVGVLLLDIPTGFFADRFGRKWALAGTNLSLVIGTLLIALGHSMPVFLLAELFYALAIALDSGVNSAYLFEFLRQQKLEANYFRYDAFGTFLALISVTLGTLVAGYYAERDLTIPIFATAALTLIGLPAACLLPSLRAQRDESHGEQTGLIETEEAITLRGIATIAREAFTTPPLRWALLVTAVWFWSRQFINLFISQPYFLSINLHYRDFGALYSVLTFTSGLIAFFSRRFVQVPDLRPITAIGLAMIPASMAIMGLVPGHAGLAGFFLFAIPYGLCTSVTNTHLNRQYARHGSRATFLSLVDTTTRLMASVLALGLGWILARQGAKAALLAAAVFAGIYVVGLLPGLKHYGIKKSST